MSGVEDQLPPPPPPSPPPLIDTQGPAPSQSADPGQESEYQAHIDVAGQQYTYWQPEQSQLYVLQDSYDPAYGQGYEHYLSQQDAAAEPLSAPLPPAKRQKTDDDGMAIALKKVSVHISNPKKFLKASPLLRQLFTEGKLSGAHGDLVFECLRGAMRNVSAAAQRADMRKEYIKLFSIASTNSQIFSAREKLQLDVFGLLAVLQNQIQTDDSFVLNRILARIKESINNLPDADESDDKVLMDFQERISKQAAVEAAAPNSKGSLAAGRDSDKAESADCERNGGNAAESSSEEEAWTEQESLCMKRDALITCLEAAKGLHGKQWAQTSIEIGYEEALKNCHKFCTSQQARLQALASFAQSERLARKQGRSAAREDRRDRTAFETARKEWSKTSGISIRKAVGGGGDHHSEVWLG